MDSRDILLWQSYGLIILVLQIFASPSFVLNPRKDSPKKKLGLRISYFSVRFSVLSLMDLWQLEMDSLTFGSVVGVVELKGQCMRFPLSQLGSLASLAPRFFGEFSKGRKKRAANYYPEQRKRGRKTEDFVWWFCDFEDAGVSILL